MMGYQVRFMTGSDEHGEKIEKKAIAAGMSYEKVIAIETAQYYDEHPEKRPAEETAAEIEEEAVAEAVNEAVEAIEKDI